MKISDNLKYFSPQGVVALTIGNFDGVHLGHQLILQRLQQSAPYPVVFTFSNHPQEILQGKIIPKLTTLEHRLTLLEKAGVKHVVIVPFTRSFSQQTAREFLSQIKKEIPFCHLILGHDAMLGSDRQSDLRTLCGELSFSLEYLPPVSMSGQIISSTAIRESIQKGHLSQASLFLGRPYSIAAAVHHGCGLGSKLGFHTANLPVEQMVLPPCGVYAVEVLLEGKPFPAIANLGKAPTLHQDRPICLEVHLLHTQLDLYGKTLEVIFQKFIRPEKKFDSLQALQSQIEADIRSISHPELAAT